MWPRLPSFSVFFLPHRAMATPATPHQAINNQSGTLKKNVAEPGKDPPLATEPRKQKPKGGRDYVKKSMEEKKSNKGWADGLRSEVLGKYIPRFKTAWFGPTRATDVDEVRERHKSFIC